MSRKIVSRTAMLAGAVTFVAVAASATATDSASAAAPASASAAAPASASAAASASASAAAPASAPASASASASAPEPAGRSIGEWSPPDSASDKPSAEEWEKAEPLELLRPNERCRASAVREWIRISCLDPPGDFKGLRVVGGSEKDVSIIDYKQRGRGLDEFHDKEIEKDVAGIHVVFPVRKGDRRVMTIVTAISGGWKSWTQLEDTVVTISEAFLPGDERPTIVVH